MPKGLGLFAGTIYDGKDKKCDHKCDKCCQKSSDEKIQLPKLPEIPVKPPSSTQKPLPNPPTNPPINNVFCFPDSQRDPLHPMRRTVSFAEHPPAGGRSFHTSNHYRYEQTGSPHPSWSHPRGYYAPHYMPPPPYMHSSSFTHHRVSDSVPHQTFPGPFSPPYDTFAAHYDHYAGPGGAIPNCPDSKQFPPWPNRGAPHITISSKPTLHIKYSPGYEHLRTPIGFYPYSTNPNINGISWLAREGYTSSEDIVISFEDYDEFIRCHCPYA
ncbi:hypothetical protein FLONG3_1351 [Fusarium longipes]|uniref:Uncharacterized protein n=1 Tax=Fusarium longipes TaxID=694270 RepID=A0A395T7N2_9HYPO|nr:hypothetical protein FLONG3_1351 [Fusarium longipes]